ncbi:DNA repair protein Rad4 [Gracilaria domingensis]|nr:DNA repair protein Rad4 [Gracilaria domingensis]
MSSSEPQRTLNGFSQNAVRSAVTRGRKRARSAQSPEDLSASRAANSSSDTRAVRTPYHKRRKASLIPHAEGSDDDDSNDEWEEHVHVDQRTVHAVGAAVSADNENGNAQKSTDDTRVPESLEADARAEEQKNKLSEEEKRKMRRKLSARLRKSRLRVHTAHLVLLAAHMMRQDDAANSSLCRAIAMSVLPEDTFLQEDNLKQQLARFALWMRSTFQTAVLVTQQGDLRSQSVFRRPCNASERIILCAQKSKGELIDIASLACALVRAQNFRCRLVLALQPLPFRVKQGRTEFWSGRHQVMDARANDVTESVLYAWIEVWSPEDSAWIVVDVFSGQVNQGYSREVIDVGLLCIPVFDSKLMDTDTVEKSTPKRRGSRRHSTRRKKQQSDSPIRRVTEQYYSHVVAAENGLLIDVSRRYVINWLQAEDCRARGKIFENVLKNLSGPYDVKVDKALQSELEEFELIAGYEKIPTTVTAVQKHPRYVLERHIKRYELIWPKEPIVGYVKDEPIFLRANVKLLHTRDRWIREMREVKQNAKPMKSVKSKNGTDTQVQLFGEWQTKRLEISPCMNGKVPRGVHGNVDLWTLDHLPDGAEHINVPHAKVAARKVGVDCAPAMTGFDIRGGRSIPRIEGVVVAAENADVVRDAAREIGRLAHERAEKRAREEALARWAKLLRAVKMGQKVKKKYGGAGSSTYEAEQKREGLRRAGREKSGASGLAAVNRGRGDGAEAVAAKLKLGKEHEHDFDEGVHVEGDTWMKKCSICELEVSYERL